MVKTSKEEVLDYVKEETAKGINQLDTQTVSDALNMQRSNVSTLLNQLVKEGLVLKTKTRPVYYSLVQEDLEEDGFSKMVGYDRSLKNVTQLAKAAILYPGKSLNTLIVGENGSGKSYLAYLMFEYAKRTGKVRTDAVYRKINCRHFVNNPSEVTNLIFGKSSEKESNLIDISEGSILFIDNIDVLDGTNIARLTSFIENGMYIYPDGTASSQKNVTLIISVDSKANHDLLKAIGSKIPVRIDMPALSKRPTEERFEIINQFFTEEAVITKHDIKIEPEVMHSLLLVDKSVNLKLLNGSIKIAVANAYLRSYDNITQRIEVLVGDFPDEMMRGIMHYRKNFEILSESIPSNFSYIYSKEGKKSVTDPSWNDFYTYLNTKIETLHQQNKSKEEIDSILNVEFQSLVSQFKQEIQSVGLNMKQLSKVVDVEVIEMVTQFIDDCSERLNVQYPNSVSYGLCLHINALIKEKREPSYLKIEKVNEVMTHYANEYQQAEVLSKKIFKKFGKQVSVDETVMLAMFLIQEEKKVTSFPQILFAMHGNTSASSIADVVNGLVKLNNTYAYDMPLDKESDQAYIELKKMIQEIDQGSGVIVIYDMGSLKTILQRIMSELDLEIRLVYMPITLIGIDASRKAAMDNDIDSVYHNLISGLNKMRREDIASQVAIITLCHTGEGGAQEIKEYLQKNYRDDIKIYPLAISERKKLIKEVQSIKRYYEIKAFVGTYDPKLFGIPFVPVSQIFENSPKEFDSLILSNIQPKEIDFEPMVQYLSEELGVDKEKLNRTLPELIENLDAYYGLNVDQKVGLFLHLGALINRIIHGVPIIHKDLDPHEWEIYREDLMSMKEALRKTERIFEIIIPDSEIVTLYEIVRKEPENE